MIGRPDQVSTQLGVALVIGALVVVSVSSCVIVRGPPPAPRQVERPIGEQSRPVEPASYPQEEAVAQSVAPVDEGFTHCCGDSEHVMQIDCDERLLRCYVKDDDGWHQTFGHYCKESLGDACYAQGCLDVCDGP